jgi:hypothetical protein
MRHFCLGIAVFLTGLCCTSSVASQELNDPAAIREFKAANACVLQHDYDCAIERFLASYAAENLPLTLYNIGRMHEFKREFVTAREFYQRFLDNPGAADSTYIDRATTGIEMADVLHPRAVELEVRTAEAATVVVDGEAVGKGPVVRASLPPGEHVVGASLEGHDPWEMRVDLVGTTVLLAELRPTREDAAPARVVVEKLVPTAQSPLVTGGWIATGAGGVALAFGLFTNLQHAETLARVNEAADDGDAKRRNAVQADLDNLELASLLGYTVAGVSLTTAAVLLWLGYTEEDPSQPALELSISPTLDGFTTTFRW